MCCPDSVRSAALKFLNYSDDDNPTTNDFEAYISSSVDSTADIDVLKWWRDNEGQLPQTAAVARRYLSVPATSVESERLFSATGRLISKLRTRLLPDNVEVLVFLNKNGNNE